MSPLADGVGRRRAPRPLATPREAEALELEYPARSRTLHAAGPEEIRFLLRRPWLAAGLALALAAFCAVLAQRSWSRFASIPGTPSRTTVAALAAAGKRADATWVAVEDARFRTDAVVHRDQGDYYVGVGSGGRESILLVLGRRKERDPATLPGRKLEGLARWIGACGFLDALREDGLSGLPASGVVEVAVDATPGDTRTEAIAATAMAVSFFLAAPFFLVAPRLLARETRPSGAGTWEIRLVGLVFAGLGGLLLWWRYSVEGMVVGGVALALGSFVFLFAGTSFVRRRFSEADARLRADVTGGVPGDSG